jgi:hypothetical protein
MHSPCLARGGSAGVLTRIPANRDLDSLSAGLPRLVGYGMVLVVLLVAVWDMVFKPGL